MLYLVSLTSSRMDGFIISCNTQSKILISKEKDSVKHTRYNKLPGLSSFTDSHFNNGSNVALLYRCLPYFEERICLIMSKTASASSASGSNSRYEFSISSASLDLPLFNNIIPLSLVASGLC